MGKGPRHDGRLVRQRFVVGDAPGDGRRPQRRESAPRRFVPRGLGPASRVVPEPAAHGDRGASADGATSEPVRESIHARHGPRREGEEDEQVAGEYCEPDGNCAWHRSTSACIYTSFVHLTVSIVRQDKKQPAYGPDFLRLWAASVDFWKDMSIGPVVIAQSAESLRKIRNTVRFCLGNMGSREALGAMQRVPRNEMGLVCYPPCF